MYSQDIYSHTKNATKWRQRGNGTEPLKLMQPFSKGPRSAVTYAVTACRGNYCVTYGTENRLVHSGRQRCVLFELDPTWASFGRVVAKSGGRPVYELTGSPGNS